MISLFDSGSGGFSVLCAIQKYILMVGILYFGDIKNVPYGEKLQKALSEHTEYAIEFLLALGTKNIISACDNSVSASIAV